MSSLDGITPWRRRKPKPSSTISRMPVATPGCPFCLDARLAGRQRHDVEQLQHQVGVLELLVALHAVLGRQLAQLVDVLGLQVGQVHPALVARRSGTDRRRSTSSRRSRSCCAALVGGARLLAARAAAAVLPSARAAAALGACFVVHRWLGSRRCCIWGTDLERVEGPGFDVAPPLPWPWGQSGGLGGSASPWARPRGTSRGRVLGLSIVRGTRGGTGIRPCGSLRGW